MSNRHHLLTADLYRLHLACRPLVAAFGRNTYLVGSVERGEGYRDVDVRTILDDKDFDRLFRDQVGVWEVMCLGIGAWLHQQTGLPIDYQIQRKTEANEKHEGPRNSLNGDLRVYAGGGDATRFIKAQPAPQPKESTMPTATDLDQHSPADPACEYAPVTVRGRELSDDARCPVCRPDWVALHDSIPAQVHACLDYDLTPEQCYTATPCAECGVRRDEHASEPEQSSFPSLDITDHAFVEPRPDAEGRP